MDSLSGLGWLEGDVFGGVAAFESAAEQGQGSKGSGGIPNLPVSLHG